MINHLSIKDFAIIENISIDFKSGLNIMTGETGSGKSIIIEAVSLALGSRADTAFVRSGKERALIQLVVEDKDGTEIIISREIFSSGKSTCRINDELVTLSHLNNVCRKIADIHGQYDHQSLLNPELHLALVDAYQSPIINPLKEDYKIKYQQYLSAKKELTDLTKNQAEIARKKDFMIFESNEINAAKLFAGEDEELAAELLILQNSELIAGNLSSAYELLYADELSAFSTLSKGLHYIKDIAGFGPELGEISVQIADIYYKLEDCTAEIRKQKEIVSYSPDQIDLIIERLDLITSLKRKYGDSIQKILNYNETLQKELEVIEHSDERLEELTESIRLRESELFESACSLSSQRRITAKIIEEKIDQELVDLNFSDASLTIGFLTQLHTDEAPNYTENGVDKVEFLITTNKGEPPKPLAKIASGGEISRIMLAFKRIIGDYDEIPTMIFDEIDSGISGMTASIVGRKLAAIADRHQVICITHLPQIAAIGDHNFRILKKNDGSHTFTIVEALSPDEKVREIARMLSGIEITEHTLKNAEELIRLSFSNK